MYGFAEPYPDNIYDTVGISTDIAIDYYAIHTIVRFITDLYQTLITQRSSELSILFLKQ